MSTNRFLDFSKPFIEAARNVFETMVGTGIETGKPFIKEGSISQGDVSAIIGMNGTKEIDGVHREMQGQFVISFPEQTYCKVASTMLMEEHEELNAEIADVGAEICNMIIGNTKKVLAQNGYNISMAVPNTVTGKQHSIKYPNKVTIIVIPVSSAHGEFFMEICYQD